LAINLTKLTKTINLNLSDVPSSERAKVKKDVGNFVVEEILRSVSGASSPVSGGRYKATLNKDYAKAMKGGNTTANLELEGDMLDALEFKTTTDGIEVGIFKSSEVPKADGHNNFTGKSKLPTRQFIPKDKQKFKRNIESGIKGIVNEAKVTKRDVDPFTSVFAIEESAERVEVQVGDLFNDDFLEQFLASEGII